MFFLLLLFGVFVTSAQGDITSGFEQSFSRSIKSPQKHLLQGKGRTERGFIPEYIPQISDDIWEKASGELDRQIKAYQKDQVLKDSRGIKIHDKGKTGGKPSWKTTTISTFTTVHIPRGDATTFDQDKFAERIGEDFKELESVMKTMNISNPIIIGAVVALCVFFFIGVVLAILLYDAFCKGKPVQKSPV